MSEEGWFDDSKQMAVYEMKADENKLAFVFRAGGVDACVYLNRTNVESLLSFLVELVGFPLFGMDFYGDDYGYHE